MKFVIVVLSVAGVCFAGDSQLFRSTGDPSLYSEQLRSAPGSESGLYHIFSSDGRLQRVSYVAAPVTNTASQVSGAYTSEGRQQQVGSLPEAKAYYVEVPAERLESLRNQGAGLQQQQYNAYTDIQQQYSPAKAYYVEVPAERLEALKFQGTSQAEQQRSAAFSQPLEVDAPFVPLQVVTADQLARQFNA